MPKIEELFAFIAADQDDDDEGVVAASIGGMGMMPLVGADMARIRELRPYAQLTASTSGKPVRLVHFTNRVEVEVIEP